MPGPLCNALTIRSKGQARSRADLLWIPFFLVGLVVFVLYGLASGLLGELAGLFGYRVRDARLVQTGNLVQQLDAWGREVSRIDLDASWTAECLEHRGDWLSFRLEQGDQGIEFTSGTSQGEELIWYLGLARSFDS